MEEYFFQMVCAICDAETHVTIINDDEKPGFCPMCGTEGEFKEQ